MSLSADSNAGEAGFAPPVRDADVLCVVSEIMAMPPEARWFQALVDRAVGALGVTYAWVRLALPGDEVRLFHSAGIGPDVAQMLRTQAWIGPDSAVTAHEPAAWLAPEHLPEAPCFQGAQARACLAGGLFSPEGQACGQVFFVWRQAPASAQAYLHALRVLASHARYAVLGNLDTGVRALRLQDAVDQYESLLQFALVLFNAFEQDGRCVMWNKECERRFGWTRQEVFEHPEPLALFYPDPEERARVVATVSSAPSRTFLEWSPHTRSGERLHTLWSNVRVPNGRILNIGLDITERKRIEAEILRRSKLDSLTECWNRREIVDRLGRMLDAARDGGPSLVVLILDLDFFKRINDCYGHLTGDVALQHFCRQLRSCLRSVDQLGRLGGEEFLAILHDVDVAAAVSLFERLREQLRANPVMLDEEPAVLTVSGGIAAWQPSMQGTSDILRSADMALYEAKRQGRDRAVVHMPSSAARYGGDKLANSAP